jgi:hypothetical protein
MVMLAWPSRRVLRTAIEGRGWKAGIIPARRSVRRTLAILFATALVSVFGATACGGVQENLQKRAQEEVEKGRQKVEQRVQEERKKAEKKVQEKMKEGQKRVEEEVRKAQ